MGLGKYTHYLYPIIFAGILLVLTLIREKEILVVLSDSAIKEILFSYSTTLFGFILATYGIFYGIVPSLDKDIRNSKKLMSVNNYFYVCSVILLIQSIISIAFIFTNYYVLFSLFAFSFGLTIAMAYYIARGIRALFTLS